MAQIQQNADGTYTKTYSDTELTLIKSLQEEINSRIAGDQELWLNNTTLANRITALEDAQVSMVDLQAALTANIARTDEHEMRLRYLEQSVIVDSYSKKEIDEMVTWKVEQIAHTFDIPANSMFDKAEMDDIRAGYRRYYRGDINEPRDNHIPENTMQRYTLWAFASSPRETTFNIRYADRCVLVVDGNVQQTYINTGGNFDSVPQVAKVGLKEGWTCIQFLLANETQAGGLVVTSDLIEKADYLSNLDYLTGMITGNRLQAGSLDESHFSPNMDLVVHTLHATATDVPGVIIGNPNEQGILQIADGTISKAKDEPFVFSDGIRVNGYIMMTMLLIDQDFIRAGDGIIVNTIKDDYGYTKMYEIVNDVRIMNGGGMHITGDAQQGYTITNDLQIKVSGGLLIEGDPIRGYLITQDLALDSLGGIEITGDAVNGYHLRNVMKLTSDFGIVSVQGNAWEGYHLDNALRIMAGGGIRIDGTIEEEGLTIVNDMLLESLGGIEVTGNGEDGYQIKNTMSIEAGGGILVEGDAVNGYTIINDMDLDSDSGIIKVTGDAETGYYLENVLEIIAGDGIDLDGSVDTGSVTINNDGVISLTEGLGIDITNNGNGSYTVKNTGVVSLSGSGDATVINNGNGSYTVNVDVDIPTPPAPPTVSGSWPIIVTKSGNNYQVSLDPEYSTGGDTIQQMQIITNQAANNSAIVPEGSDGGVAAGYFRNLVSGYQLFWFIRVIATEDQYQVKLSFKGGTMTGGAYSIEVQHRPEGGTNGDPVYAFGTGYMGSNGDAGAGNADVTFTVPSAYRDGTSVYEFRMHLSEGGVAKSLGAVPITS